jgi:hypothetical protein
VAESPPGPDPQGAVAFEVIALGRRRRRLDPGLIVVSLAAILVVAALTRPWAIGGSPSFAPVASASASLPGRVAAASPTFKPDTSPAPTPDPTPLDPTRLATVIQMLAGYSGSWGVGAAATPTAPSSSNAAASDWSAWVAVRPNAPGAVVSTNLCTGLPSLPSGAEVIAITAPSGPLVDLGIGGWRLHGGGGDPPDVERLAGLRQIRPDQGGDISYLERLDGQPWTDGRYEFLIGEAAGATTLKVCLGRP